MSDKRTSIPDPLEAWRQWVDEAERRWNSNLNEIMTSDQFSKVSGKMMEAWLGVQSSMNEATQKYFSTLNLPTRNDIIALAESLTAIDRRLGEIERRLDTIGATAPPKPARPKPSRTKKATARSAAAKPPASKAPAPKKATPKKATAKKVAVRKSTARKRPGAGQ